MSVCLAALAGAALLAGCSRGPTVTGPLTLRRAGTTAVYDPGIDRMLYLGRSDGPNALLITGDVYRPAPAGRYCFRGGTYTWIVPQNGWSDADGRRCDWPPAPAMDTGPMSVQRSGPAMLRMTGPVLSQGVRQRKQITINADGSLSLEVALLPLEQSQPAKAGIWSLTAVRRGAIIAVPKGDVRFDSKAFGAAWKAAVVEDGPWLIVDTAALSADGKAFIDAPPVIAAWRQGQWFVRIGNDADSPRCDGDAVVEVSVDRKADAVEMHLLGPYRFVLGNAANAWSELWRIIPAEDPSPAVLTPLLDRAGR